MAGEDLGIGYAQLTSQQNCAVAHTVWLRRKGNPTEPLHFGRGGVFSAGERYGVQLVLMPLSDTYFTENTRVQINGGCEILRKKIS